MARKDKKTVKQTYRVVSADSAKKISLNYLKDLCLEYDEKSYKADILETKYLGKYQSEQFQVVTFNIGLTDLSKPINLKDNLPEKKGFYWLELYLQD